MRLLLTTRTIEHLQPKDKQFNAWDTSLKAFGLRVSPRGTKTFIIIQGKKRKVTSLGTFPDLSLKDARTRAMREMSQPSSLPKTPVLEAITAFSEAMKGRVKPDTLKQYLSYLNELELESLTPTYSEILEKLRKWDTKPYAQNYAYASLRNFLNWCLETGYIEKNPLFRKQTPNRIKTRDRVLSDDELGRIWRCTEDNTYGRILRLLILTGQRRMEVRNLKPEAVTNDLITFHTKGDKINILPLTPLVEENLVLPFKFNNWGDAKRRFDEECGVSFRHHDLRRTLATKLAQFGTAFIVIERVLGHSQGGVAFTYNRHSYLPEMKAALLRFEEHIRTIAAPRHVAEAQPGCSVAT